ncbi:MAG: flagellar export protein FliJ [Clostridiales bacterium 38-18]|nr:MAG: flagellar export protein FliJ [Clostridiales bacterium 38-18]
MKKFKFRYESVLKMRMDKEEEIKNNLAKLISKKQSLLDDLEELNKGSAQYDAYITDVMSTGTASGEFSKFESGKKYYKDHRNRIKHNIQRVDEQIRLTQEALVAAVKERKIMDKLKEKAFMEFVEAINVADEKLIEEVVNFANNKKNGE